MRLIDADFLKKRIEYGQGLVEFTANQIEELLEVIDDVPTVDRPQGEWKDNKCTNCGEKAFNDVDAYGTADGYVLTPWCPWCGADMRKEGEKE